jgi:polysaccharide pyruvyl transferase WcaK-like protein
MIRTFDLLDDYELAAFSFAPHLDSERYPKKVRIVDVSRDLHLGQNILDKNIISFLKAFIFSLVWHSIFILLCMIFGTRARRFMKKPIWSAYCDSDVYIICHNGVNCVHGFVLPFSPIYITLIGRILKKPVVIYGNGTSNLKRKLWERIAAKVLESVSLITIRDETTYKYLGTVSPNLSHMYLTGDPAVLVEPVTSATSKMIMDAENIPNSGQPLIGVTMTNATLSNSGQSPQDYKRVVSEYARFFDDLIDTLQSIVIFIPHSIEFYNAKDDRKVAHLIHDSMRNKSSVRVIENEYTTEELKGLMGEFDLIVGARIHSVIGALTVKVPSLTLATSTDERATGLVGGLLGQKQWIHRVEKLNAADLLSHTLALWTRRDDIRISLTPIVEKARRKAMLNGILLSALLNRPHHRERG